MHGDLCIQSTAKSNWRTMKPSSLEMVQSILRAKCWPKSFWEDAVVAAVYVRKRLSSRSLPDGKTPYDMWNSVKPNLSHLNVFGSKFRFKLPQNEHQKLDDPTRRAIFIGFAR